MSTTMNRVKHLPDNTGRTFAHLGCSVSFKHEPADNGDALLLFECRMPPGAGVPPHTEGNHEAFYGLEGVLEIHADGEVYRIGPGDFLAIQPGVRHALQNASSEWVRVLTWVTPGSQHVRFFERLGEPIEDPLAPPQPEGPPDVEELVAVALESGMDFRQ